MCEVQFGLDDDSYQDSIAVRHVVPVDRSRESARNVSISLKNRAAKFLKVRLYFASEWILLSEVAFESGESFQLIFYLLVSKYSYKLNLQFNSIAWRDFFRLF